MRHPVRNLVERLPTPRFLSDKYRHSTLRKKNTISFHIPSNLNFVINLILPSQYFKTCAREIEPFNKITDSDFVYLNSTVVKWF
jgi:hypothetical protein